MKRKLEEIKEVSEDTIPEDKNNKNQEKLPKTKDSLEYCLDRLAWLLERSTKSCISVTLCNRKLLIADNGIGDSLRDNNKVIVWIEHVMNYFSTVAQGHLESGSLSEQRKELFEKIFSEKFKGQGLGDFNPVKEYQPFLTKELLEILDQEGVMTVSKENLKTLKKSKWWKCTKKATHSSEEMAAAYQLGLNIIRRLLNIEHFLTMNGNETSLKQVLLNHQFRIVRLSHYEDPTLNDYTWMQSKEESGYALLAINGDGVHAESKIIDFLLATDMMTGSESEERKTCLMGLSKTCCFHCHDVVQLTNKSFKELNSVDYDYLIVTDTHHRKFDKWNKCKPVFLINKKNRAPGKSGEIYSYVQAIYKEDEKVNGFYSEAEAEKFQVCPLIIGTSGPSLEQKEQIKQGKMIYVFKEKDQYTLCFKNKEGKFESQVLDEENKNYREILNERKWMEGKCQDQDLILFINKLLKSKAFKGSQLISPYEISYYKKREIKLSSMIKDEFSKKYKNFKIISSESIKCSCLEQAKKYLSQPEMEGNFIVYRPDKTEAPQFIGRHYLDGNIIQVNVETKLPKKNIVFSSINTKSMNEEIRKNFGYGATQEKKDHMSQESAHTSSHSSQEVRGDSKADIFKQDLISIINRLEQESVTLEPDIDTLIKNLTSMYEEKKIKLTSFEETSPSKLSASPSFFSLSNKKSYEQTGIPSPQPEEIASSKSNKNIIEVAGDNNCAFYAFGLGLMENIYDKTLRLDKEAHATFLQTFGQNSLNLKEMATVEEVTQWVKSHYTQRDNQKVYRQFNTPLRFLTSVLVRSHWSSLVKSMIDEVSQMIEQSKDAVSEQFNLDNFQGILRASSLKDGEFGKKFIPYVLDNIESETWKDSLNTWLIKQEAQDCYVEGVVNGLWASKAMELPLLGQYFGVTVYIENNVIHESEGNAEIHLIMPHGIHYDYQLKPVDKLTEKNENRTDQEMRIESEEEVSLNHDYLNPDKTYLPEKSEKSYEPFYQEEGNDQEENEQEKQGLPKKNSP